MIKSANPALNSQIFTAEARVASSEKMTVQGTVNKTGILLLCVIATASVTWGRFFNGENFSSNACWAIYFYYSINYYI